MKIGNYQDKNKKILPISIGVIVIIGVSFLLSKISFVDEEHGNYGENDVYLAFYNGNEKLKDMPQKDNSDNLEFERGECDNGASIVWNENEWAPLIKNLNKSNTKCTLFFGKKIKAIEYLTNIAKNNNDLIYDGKENLGSDFGTDDNNLRYIGRNPNNYIRFNDEIWRIIGVMKVETSDGNIEERVKIIRQDEIENQKNFGSYIYDLSNNNWVTSTLKNMLNGIYFNSSIGDCNLTNEEVKQCDFTGNGEQPKGLKDVQNMIDTDINWNLGGALNAGITPKEYYTKERSNLTANSGYPSIWTLENDSSNHNGVGLMYPSDYGYAVGLDIQNTCLNKNVNQFENDCYATNWLYKRCWSWFMTPNASDARIGIYFNSDGSVSQPWVYDAFRVWPTLYLKDNVYFFEDNSNDYGSIKNPIILSL